MPNYYEILEVGREATESEIKKAYRTLSLRWHPDRNSAPEANAKFQEISEAYETLSDGEKKTRYDEELSGVHRHPFSSMGGMGEENLGDIGHIFNMMFGGGGMGGMPMGGGIHVFHGGPGGGMHFPMGGGGPPPGFRIFQQLQKPPSIIKNVQIPFQSAYAGCTIHVPIEKWTVRDQLRITEMETLYVSIPAGVDDGEVIVMRDCGNTISEEVKGDIKIVVSVENNTPFLRNGMDVIYKKTITLKESLTGFSFDIVHLNGKTLCLNNYQNRTIIKPGFKKMIPGLGMNRDNHTGNLCIEFTVEFPETLSAEQLTALETIL